MFELNSLVVYPSYGVAKITSEIIKRIDANDLIFFELGFVSKDVKVLIPKENCLHGEIRGLSSRSDIEDIFKEFHVPYDDNWYSNMSLVSWNRRGKEYQMRIRRGGLHDIGMIYRDLKYIEIFKSLSFGEKAVLSQVEDLFCEEISFVYNEKMEDVVLSVRNFINMIFHKNKYINQSNPLVFEFPHSFDFLNVMTNEINR
jgi:CarD family transcriptional regulator